MITYKYKLYRNRRTRHIDDMLEEARLVWNHTLALQKRYYRLYGKFVPRFTMVKHIGKIWDRKFIGSQMLQEIVERQDKAYRRFFDHQAKRPPKFKKKGEMHSVAYKQCGYSFKGNKVRLSVGKNKYSLKLSLSRKMEGNIKTVSLRRSPLGEHYVSVTTDASPKRRAESRNGASVGIDFGLKTYLTLSDGRKISNPQFLKESLSGVRKASRRLSRSAKGSGNRERARQAYCRRMEDVVNKRTDFQWKLAHELCRNYDFIFIESLSLAGMCRRWGRKMNDYSHSAFVTILRQVADKYGVTVHEIDRWYPSSRMCQCGYKNDSLTLGTREWVCPQCGKRHDRDVNAAINILRKGISELESNGKSVPAPQVGSYASI